MSDEQQLTGNAFKNTEQFEPIRREAADKLVTTPRLALSESQLAVIWPKNNQPSHHESKSRSFH